MIPGDPMEDFKKNGPFSDIFRRLAIIEKKLRELFTTSGAGVGAIPDHDHSGDAGDGGAFDAAKLGSDSAADGNVLTADGAGGAAWESPGAGSGDVIQDGAITVGHIAIFSADHHIEDGGGATAQIDQSGGTSDTHGVLAGARNGSNTTFTVSQGSYTSGNLMVYLNGQLQTQGTAEDWVETDPSAGTFDFVTPPIATDEITVVYGYQSIYAQRRMQSIMEFCRNSNYPVTGLTAGTSYIWPGYALSSSTFKLHVDKMPSAQIVYARWVVVWDPNAPGATPTGVRLVKFDDGPTNIEVLKTIEVANETDEIVSTEDVTTDLQAILAGGVVKQLGQQVRGDGANTGLIYSSIIEIVWG